MDVVGRTCMGRNKGQLFFLLLFCEAGHMLCMLTWPLQVANLGNKRVTCLVLVGWPALFCVLDLHKGQGDLDFICGVTFPFPACSTGKKLAQMRKHRRNLLEPVWESLTGGVSSKVSEHGRAVSRGHRHRMVSDPGATVPVGNCNHFH